MMCCLNECDRSPITGTRELMIHLAMLFGYGTMSSKTMIWKSQTDIAVTWPWNLEVSWCGTMSDTELPLVHLKKTTNTMRCALRRSWYMPETSPSSLEKLRPRLTCEGSSAWDHFTKCSPRFWETWHLSDLLTWPARKQFGDASSMSSSFVFSALRINCLRFLLSKSWMNPKSPGRGRLYSLISWDSTAVERLECYGTQTDVIELWAAISVTVFCDTPSQGWDLQE